MKAEAVILNLTNMIEYLNKENTSMRSQIRELKQINEQGLIMEDVKDHLMHIGAMKVVCCLQDNSKNIMSGDDKYLKDNVRAVLTSLVYVAERVADNIIQEDSQC